jgi:2-polyprenyl-3-methyl-5-hydroxy-6-metoxy-1,4-benzoquinol methylase
MDSYKITFDTWNKLASAYQDKFMDLDLYNDTYDIFCQLVNKPQASIFEIGCGPGNITRYLLAKRPDFKLEAIDIAPSMIELARTNNPTARFSVMDCRDIDQLPGPYDAILCGFCMPYLSKEDCVKLIKDSAALLEDDGIFYFSAIEGDDHQSGWETDSSEQNKLYVYYHQEDYLRKALTAHQFDLLYLNRKSYPITTAASSSHMIFIARKK